MSRLDYLAQWLFIQKAGDILALNDHKITSTDEQGKLHTGQPQRLSDEFQTYQEVQAFMDSYGQLVKNKHNGLIDEVSQQLEHKADIIEKPVNWKTELDLPSAYPKGLSLFTSTNSFLGLTYVNVLTLKADTFMQQVLFRNYDNPLKIRYSDGGQTVWSTSVVELATTDKIDNLFESGIWTPTLYWNTQTTAPIVTASEGYYYKSNKLIYLHGSITISDVGVGNGLRVGGLPFASKNRGITYPANYGNSFSNAAPKELVFYLPSSLAVAQFSLKTEPFSNFNNTVISAGKINFSMSYEIA